MVDREYVLFALDCYASQRARCDEKCPYFNRIAVGSDGYSYGHCAKTNIARDAITLIEQKPMEPIIENGFSYCGVCGRSLDSDFADEEVFPFCPNCGRRVKWNADD